MAATELTKGKTMFTVKAIDADWVSTEALKVRSIIFQPSAVNDILMVNEYIAGDTTDSGVQIKSIDGGPVGFKLHNDGVKFKPWIDFSECTFGTAANVRVTFVLGN